MPPGLDSKAVLKRNNLEETTLNDGRTIAWDFGYSCDETFEAAQMTAWLDDRLGKLDFSANQADLDKIRREASERFTLELSPC